MSIGSARGATILILAIMLGFAKIGWTAPKGASPAANPVAVATPVLSMVSEDHAESGVTRVQVTFAPGLHESVRETGALRLTGFPVGGEVELDFDLEPFEITSPATQIVLVTDAGEVQVPLPEISVLRGHVVDDPESNVLLTISPQHVYGVITARSHSSADLSHKTYVVFPERTVGKTTGPLVHTLQCLDDLRGILPPEPTSCLVECQSEDLPIEEGGGHSTKKFVARGCQMALECDYELWQNVGEDLDAALANIYAVWGGVSAMYENDVDVRLGLDYLRIWATASDPYSYVGGGVDGLREFENYWRANHNPGQPDFKPRDLAHLRSGRGVGAYGEVGVLCSYDYGFAIAGGQGWPNGYWHDVVFVAHEIGHNFDGLHTHCFNPPLDQCGVEPGCNQTFDCAGAPSTMMSYCDSCPGGLSNILAQFASANVTRMRAEIDASCLGLSYDPVYVDWRNTGSEDGTLAHPYKTVTRGSWYVVSGGTVSIADGTYSNEAWGLFVQPMVMRARGGSAIIDPTP